MKPTNNSAYALNHIEWDRKPVAPTEPHSETPPAAAETFSHPDIRESAEWIAAILRDHQVEADYSPASLATLDRFLAGSVSAQLPGSNDFFSEDFSYRSFAMGAYVGEVLRQSLGGDWESDEKDPLIEINIALRLSEKQSCQPMKRVLERLNTGPSRSFVRFAAENGLTILESSTEEDGDEPTSPEDFNIRGFVMLWHTPAEDHNAPAYHFAADTTACVNLLGYFTFLESKTIPSLKSVDALTEEDGVVLPESHAHGETRQQMGIFFDPGLASDYWRLVDDNGQLYIEMGQDRLKEFKDAVTTIFLGHDTPVVGTPGEQLQLWPKAKTEEDGAETEPAADAPETEA